MKTQKRCLLWVFNLVEITDNLIAKLMNNYLLSFSTKQYVSATLQVTQLSFSAYDGSTEYMCSTFLLLPLPLAFPIFVLLLKEKNLPHSLLNGVTSCIFEELLNNSKER